MQGRLWFLAALSIAFAGAALTTKLVRLRERLTDERARVVAQAAGERHISRGSTRSSRWA